MNELRERSFEWHSALQFAAAAQPGLGPQREALYRSAISQYGRWTYKAMLKSGYKGPDLAFYAGSLRKGNAKVGGSIADGVEKTGQLRFIQ